MTEQPQSSSPSIPDIDSMSLEECSSLLNELQGKAQRMADLPDEEVRLGVKLLIKIRGRTSAEAAQRRGRGPGPAPSLDEF